MDDLGTLLAHGSCKLLQAELKRRELPVSGNKDALIARIRADMLLKSETEVVPTGPPPLRTRDDIDSDNEDEDALEKAALAAEAILAEQREEFALAESVAKAEADAEAAAKAAAKKIRMDELRARLTVAEQKIAAGGIS